MDGVKPGGTFKHTSQANVIIASCRCQKNGKTFFPMLQIMDYSLEIKVKKNFDLVFDMQKVVPKVSVY